MAREREEQGQNKAPQDQLTTGSAHPASQDVEFTADSMTVRYGEQTLYLRKRESDQALSLQVRYQEGIVFAAAFIPHPETKTVAVKQNFEVAPLPPVGDTPQPRTEPLAVTQEQLLTQEAGEYPEITIEGWPVRAGHYDRDKHTYHLRIAHHPNPNDRETGVFYDLLASGEKAKECFAVRVTDKSRAVHVTGELHTRMMRKRSGGMQEVREIQIDSLEKLPQGQVDSPDLYNEKRTLADLE